MQSELPDLDEVVSFVVDEGTSLGPVPMRDIISSVSSGERDPSVLVWWAGATDWIRFDSSDELMAVAGDIPPHMHAQPVPEVFEPVEQPFDEPAAEAFDPVEEPSPEVFEPVAQQPLEEPVAQVFDPVAEQPFEEPVAQVFDPVAEQPFEEPAAEVFEPVAQQHLEDPASEMMQPIAEQPLEPVAEPAAQPTTQAFEPSSLSPVHKPESATPAPAPAMVQTTDDDGWSVLSEYSEPTEAPAPEPAVQTQQPAHAADAPAVDPFAAQQQAAIAAAAAREESPPAPEAGASDEGFSFNLPTREASEPTDGLVKKAAITGLFSSGARDGSEDGEAPVPSADALDAILVARASLESVGARIEALSSATKRSLTPEQIQSGVDDSVDPNAVQPATPQVAGAPSQAAPHAEPAAASGSWTAVEADAGPAADTHGVDMSSARAELNQRFKEMVAKSVEHQRRIEWITRVDELLLSACITAIADSGFVASDLNSRESDHRVMFDHNDDSRKVRLDLAPLETVSQLGRHVKFGLSWGRDTTDPDRAFEIVRQNTTDGLVPPGVLTSEADMATSSISVRVELILAADDFVKDDYSVDRPSLDSSIAAALHALEMHWHELFDAA